MKEFIEKLIGRLEEREVQAYAKMDGGVTYQTYRNAIEIVIQLAEEYNNDFCEWKPHEREIDVYFTECGQAHIFIDGNPEENNHVFCPYCGKKIKVAPYQPKGE